MEKKIAVIGSGISGLVACKHAMEKGFSPMLFEAKSGIGGVWRQTLESTKLQTTKHLYQFTDFDWPDSVKETFPDHNQVMEHLEAYAAHFNILPRIKFNSKVISIDYVTDSKEELLSWDLWGDTGEPFSNTGNWNMVVQDCRNASAATAVYQVDFVIPCIGKYSDLPNIQNFPVNKGPEAFHGKVLYSMDYAAMDDNTAAEFIKGNRVTVVGLQKSAVDLAAEISHRNGTKSKCMYAANEDGALDSS